jgi:hypothetical protein
MRLLRRRGDDTGLRRRDSHDLILPVRGATDRRTVLPGARVLQGGHPSARIFGRDHGLPPSWGNPGDVGRQGRPEIKYYIFCIFLLYWKKRTITEALYGMSVTPRKD